jgi:hypothetical protein
MKTNLSLEEQKLIENEKQRLASIPRSKRKGGKIAKEKVNRLLITNFNSVTNQNSIQF